METIKTVIWLLNIFTSITVIILVLMQQGKGADAGATFGGSGSAQGVFGSAGNANFLSRATAIAATVFFASCLSLVYINTHVPKHGLDFSTVQQKNVPVQTEQQGATSPVKSASGTQ
ncbi:preprotein translocase subunit SecG [Neisseria wadsworthii]|uniref:preprotein translocase subunit SecG n=1 Tax=Neisseria wadsworthii TaxID=607711 RepID=UPI000D2FB6AB|nr:preprotein translocase subunit SecG [Neisseria wadsworthii]